MNQGFDDCRQQPRVRFVCLSGVHRRRPYGSRFGAPRVLALLLSWKMPVPSVRRWRRRRRRRPTHREMDNDADGKWELSFNVRGMWGSGGVRKL